MKKTHSETFTVRASECDLYRRMRLDALFLSMQEVGERHACGLQRVRDGLPGRRRRAQNGQCKAHQPCNNPFHLRTPFHLFPSQRPVW